MGQRFGVIAYSFGGSKKYGPGSANRALAGVLGNFLYMERGRNYLVVQDWLAEWSPRLYLAQLVISEHREKGKFLNTEEVTAQADQFFRGVGVRDVYLIAHPFLHRWKCRRLLKLHGFKVRIVRNKPHWIPFDPNSDGWWTRGALRFLLYVFLQLTTGRSGH